jgi:hypothetical protein
VRRRLLTRQALAGLLVTAIAAAAVPSAAARPAPPQRFGFGLAAKGFPSYFRLTSEPGRESRATLLVTNRLDHPEAVDLGSAAVSTASLGGLAFGTESDAGWLRIARRRILLPAGATVGVPFTVDVPRSATPGQHYLGLVATPKQERSRRLGPSGRISLHLITRLAMTVEMSVPGPRHHQMAVGRAGFLSEPAGAFLTVGLSNRGNTLVNSTTANVLVHYRGRRLLRTSLHLGPFVPRTTISLHLPWSALLRPGRYIVTGVIRPAGQPAVHFRRVLVVAPRVVAAAAAEAGARIVDQRSQLPLEIGIAALGPLLAFAIGAWYRERARRVRPGGA